MTWSLTVPYPWRQLSHLLPGLDARKLAVLPQDLVHRLVQHVRAPVHRAEPVAVAEGQSPVS